MSVSVALYARVSSDQQVQAATIQSQISALKEKISEDKHTILRDYEFADEGYSGTTLIRPALEQLRDTVANNLITKLYIHSPDRLARKYAYQYLLIEEFEQQSVEIVFLDNQLSDNPESNLLLQIQGVIAEYERTKIMERSRRGRIHAAKRGSVSVLAGAPYGYDYIPKHMNNGVAYYKINEEKAKIIHQMFVWIGKEKMSIMQVANRLNEMSIPTQEKRNNHWSSGTVGAMLKNTAYMGKAAYGKKKNIPKRHTLRPARGCSAQTKSYCSVEKVPEEKWIYIDVPVIVDKNLFMLVQAQLAENKKRMRTQKKKSRFLLSGLAVCDLCQYCYAGTQSGRKRAYYVCGGKRAHKSRNQTPCRNKAIRSEILDAIVWQEILTLLNNPGYIEKEYQQRMLEIKKNPNQKEQDDKENEKLKLTQNIDRLIDSYTEGLINKLEFAPRIKSMRERLVKIEQYLIRLTDNDDEKNELQEMMESIATFSKSVEKSFDSLDFAQKREIITAIIKRIEIGDGTVNIVFKVDNYFSPALSGNSSVYDCRRRA